MDQRCNFGLFFFSEVCLNTGRRKMTGRLTTLLVILLLSAHCGVQANNLTVLLDAFQFYAFEYENTSYTRGTSSQGRLPLEYRSLIVGSTRILNKTVQFGISKRRKLKVGQSSQICLVTNAPRLYLSGLMRFEHEILGLDFTARQT